MYYYSLKQYQELILSIWRSHLDTENKSEISETKFFKFLRDHKIVTEKKQIDEMYKQCIFASKKENLTNKLAGSNTVTLQIYQRLFAKPLLLIAMENALSLVDASTNNQHRDRPEMDKSSLGQTVAVMNFQRQYMKRVFVSEELKAYENFKKAAKRVKKQRNESSTQ